MKSVFLIPAILAVAAWSAPVSCALLPKDRAVDKPGCRCAINTGVDGKRRVSISACGNAYVTGENYEFKSDSLGWYRIMYRMCVRLEGTTTYSCKTYNYLQENYKDDPLYESFSVSEYRDDLGKKYEPGDVDYLFGKSK